MRLVFFLLAAFLARSSFGDDNDPFFDDDSLPSPDDALVFSPRIGYIGMYMENGKLTSNEVKIGKTGSSVNQPFCTIMFTSDCSVEFGLSKADEIASNKTDGSGVKLTCFEDGCNYDILSFLEPLEKENKDIADKCKKFFTQSSPEKKNIPHNNEYRDITCIASDEWARENGDSKYVEELEYRDHPFCAVEFYENCGIKLSKPEYAPLSMLAGDCLFDAENSKFVCYCSSENYCSADLKLWMRKANEINSSLNIVDCDVGDSPYTKPSEKKRYCYTGKYSDKNGPTKGLVKMESKSSETVNFPFCTFEFTSDCSIYLGSREGHMDENDHSKADRVMLTCLDDFCNYDVLSMKDRLKAQSNAIAEKCMKYYIESPEASLIPTRYNLTCGNVNDVTYNSYTLHDDEAQEGQEIETRWKNMEYDDGNNFCFIEFWVGCQIDLTSWFNPFLSLLNECYYGGGLKITCTCKDFDNCNTDVAYWLEKAKQLKTPGLDLRHCEAKSVPYPTMPAEFFGPPSTIQTTATFDEVKTTVTVVQESKSVLRLSPSAVSLVFLIAGTTL